MVKKGNEGFGLTWDRVKLSWVAHIYTKKEAKEV